MKELDERFPHTPKVFALSIIYVLQSLILPTLSLGPVCVCFMCFLQGIGTALNYFFLSKGSKNVKDCMRRYITLTETGVADIKSFVRLMRKKL